MWSQGFLPPDGQGKGWRREELQDTLALVKEQVVVSPGLRTGKCQKFLPTARK